MPIHYRPDHAAHIAWITGEGRVTYEDCLGLIEAQRADVGRRLHELNDYRNDLRTAFIDIATTQADRTITGTVTADHTWGTATTPEVTSPTSAPTPPVVTSTS